MGIGVSAPYSPGMNVGTAFRKHRSKILLIVAFFAIGFAAYGRVATYGFVTIDDDVLIYDNPIVKAGLTPASVYGAFVDRYDPELYIPLTFLSYELDATIAGAKPFIFHLTNLILHIFNALLVVVVVKLLSRKEWIAVACGLLFLVHPLHTEAVAWASSRKDLLSALFFLGSFALFLDYRIRRKIETYRLSVASFALSLLSKVMAATLPAVLVLEDVRRNTPRTKRWWLELSPFAALSALFLAIGFAYKKGIIANSSYVTKIILAFKSACFYLWELVWPEALRIVYLQETPVRLSAEFLLPMIVVAALLVLAMIAWRREKTRFVGWGILFYFLTLAPTFINSTKGNNIYFASDRYAYIPSIGIFLAACVAIDLIIVKLPSRWKQPLAFAGIAVCTAFAVAAWNQSSYWENGVTAFTRSLEFHPTSALALVNRGVAYEAMGKDDEALNDYVAATHYEPSVAATWFDIGNVLAKKNDLQGATNAYLRAVATDITLAPAHAALAKTFLRLGRTNDARAALQNAYMIDPDYVVEKGGFTKQELDALR